MFGQEIFLKRDIFFAKGYVRYLDMALPVFGVVIVPFLYKLLYFITFIIFPYLIQYDTDS